MQKSELFRRMLKSKFFMAGLIMFVILLAVLIAGPMLTEFDPTLQDITSRNKAPEWFSNGFAGHILGTDPLGRDLFSRLVNGGRVSLQISIVVVICNSVMGTLLGLAAGYFGGVADNIIMRVTEIVMSLPQAILCICIMALLGPSITNFLIVCLITRWVGFTRMARATVLSIRNSEYIQASKVMGGKDGYIILTQVLPNVLTPLIIVASQSLGGVILLETSLSYLGCGIPVNIPSWGGMISAGREYLATQPHTVIVPGLALMYTILCLSFLGDGVRDVLDPHNID